MYLFETEGRRKKLRNCSLNSNNFMIVDAMETRAENFNHWENQPNPGKSTGL